MNVIEARQGVRMSGGIAIGPSIGVQLAGRGGGGGPSYEFGSGTLAGEVERLTADGNYTLTVDGNSLPVEYIQHDGDLTISTNTNYGDETPDERMVCVKVNGNLTVNSGVTVSTPVRKLGLLFYVTGDVQIDGTIDMTARGANHSPSGSDLEEFDLLVVDGIGADGIVPAAGGAGAEAVAINQPGNTGGAGSNGGTGGGGSGSSVSGTGGNGHGAAGTLFSGGPGGGGRNSNQSGATSGTERGGPGGNSSSPAPAGGGAGNPAGTSSAGDGAENGTGGLIILIGLGTVTVSATGIIRANGSAGGSATACGGGSGGGSISLYRRGSYTNSGTVQANGGAGGTHETRPGGNGGAGSVRVVQL